MAVAVLSCYMFALIVQNQVRDLKEMCEFLKKEKAEVDRKLGRVRGVSLGEYAIYWFGFRDKLQQ